MDEEIAEDIELAEDYDDELESPSENQSKKLGVVISIIITCICVVNLLVCFFIIFLIKRFKKLRVQFYTGYILHCTVTMSGILLLPFFVHFLFPIMAEGRLQLSHCILSEGILAILSGQHILYTSMTIDFAVATFDTGKSEKFRRIFSHIVIGVYLYILVCGVVAYQFFCICGIMPYLDISIDIITFGSYIITIIIVSVAYLYKRIKFSAVVDSTALKISATHLLLLPFYILIFFVHSHYYTLTAACLALCNPLIIIALTYFCDINFRGCIIEALRCNCKKYGNAENAEEDNITIAYDHQNSQVIQVS